MLLNLDHSDFCLHLTCATFAFDLRNVDGILKTWLEIIMYL